MNVFSPSPEAPDTSLRSRADVTQRAGGLGAFACRNPVRTDAPARIAAILAVAAVHILAGALYVLGKPSFAKSSPDRAFAVVQIQPEAFMPLPPPLPIPDFKAPPVNVPAPIIPLLEVPPPPATNAITVPQPISASTPSVRGPLATDAPAEMSSDERAAYLGALLRHLNRHKRYPEAAKLRHERGVVSVGFSIDSNGHVIAVALVKSSGSESLDKESIAAVRRADPLPPIPASFGRDSLDLVVPVDFVLR